MNTFLGPRQSHLLRQLLRLLQNLGLRIGETELFFLSFMFYLTRNVFKKYSVFVSTSKITNLVRLLYELKGTVSREKFSN